MQLSLLTVDIQGSNFAMHFSTISPPLPSLLILVTKGPALLEQPEITITDRAVIKSAVTFFILPPMAYFYVILEEGSNVQVKGPRNAVPSERSEGLEPFVRQRASSRTQDMLPQPSLIDEVQGVSALAPEVICDVHIL